ncbi:hypothetical protein Areg01_29950 [Actinoplanes regularis]|nr:hypothetical protein Areg01_29950 [Actinoplanes regularis]
MYHGMLPKTGISLTMAGMTLSVLNVIWVGVALAVIGGMLITLSKFGPRIALEPLPVGVRGSRFRLTVNGEPAFKRSR